MAEFEEEFEETPVDVEEEGLPAPDPELEGTLPQFASTEDEEEEAKEVGGDQEEEPFYQKGKAPSYESLARELRHRDRDYRVLEQRFNQVMEMLQDLQAPAAEEEGEQPPDPNEDPAGFLAWKMDQIEKNQKLTKEEQDRKERIQAVERQLQQADSAVYSFREQVGGQEYDEAVEYLVQSTMAELEMANPGMTTQEIASRVAQGITQQKLEWTRQGLNPGQMWWQVATGRGWRPSAQQKQQKRQQMSGPKQEIQQMQKRQQKARTVGKMAGSPVGGRMDARKALSLDEEQWNRSMNAQNLSMRDLLAGKARAGS